jgi:hypothetical protein
MTSCYQTYTGIYFLNRSHEVSRAQAEVVARDLGVALADFGFSAVHEQEIREMSNAEETEFVEALRRTIERQLEVNGISGARFERQKDFLFF